MSATSIFERVGGFARVSRVVSAFYDKVMESGVLSPYFQNVDMRRLIDHQTKFVASIMGGPASYSNEELERVHARLGITARAFDEMAALLKEAMEDFEFAEEDIATVVREVTSRKRFIVTSSG